MWEELRLGFMLFALLLFLASSNARGQVTSSVRYSYDDSGQLTRVIDASGNQVIYAYDAAGNITSITRGQAPGIGTLAILNFTPQTGAVGATVTIQGQNFSTTASSNAVTFNGSAATVLSASASILTASVPPTATTGPISVTVNGITATSTSNFTVISAPYVLGVSPQFAISSGSTTTIPNFTVTGVNFTNSTFSFTPAFNPASVIAGPPTINTGGTSATMSLTVAGGVKGTYTLLATNSVGTSSPVATSSNTLQIIDPDGDADGDGITNAVEIAIGSNPINATTSGAGIADGWQVFYGLNPLSASSSGLDPGKSGNTALQDFQQNLSPINPNRVPPGVIQISPASGASNVFINSVIVVRFGEPLQIGTSLFAAQTAISKVLGTSTTVSASSQAIAATTLQAYLDRTCCGNTVIPGVVTVSGPYGAITGGLTASSDGLSVTFAPSVPLTSNTTYTVKVNGVRDSAGNLMTTPFTSTFSTGASLDNSIPTIKLVDPEANSTNVPTNAHYTVQFSKPMDPASLNPTSFSITDQTTSQQIAGTIQVDASGLTASFIPSLPLPVDRTFTVALSTAIKDTVSNNLASASTYYFTTGYVPETAAPHLVSNSPVTNATGIPVNAIIDLLFSQPLNITTAVPNIQISANGQPIAVQTALSGGDQRVTMTPVSGLQASTQYTVTVTGGIANIAGTLIDNAGSYTFTTAPLVDKATLTITAFDPASGATSVPLNAQMRVSFSKPVDVVSLGSGNVELYPYSVGTSTRIAGTYTTAADATSMTFTPAAPLLLDTKYCLALTSIVDLEGNALSGTSSVCFTTGASSQSSGPVVVGVSPGNGATGVPVNGLVEVSLSEPVSVVSVGQSAIVVSAGGQAVAGTVTVPNSTTLLFTPSSSLAVSTAYTVTVGGFTDLAGNAATSFTSGFTTSSSSTAVKTGPTIVSVSPANSTTNVAVTAPIVVTFSAAVNPLTVTNASVRVFTGGNTLAGSYAVNGAVVTFTPLTALPGSASIQVYVDYYGNVQDLAGNNASSSATSFTTAATVDTTAPTVLTVVPANGQTGVGLNGQITVVFSESMNPSTLTTSTIALLAGGVKQSFSPSISADNRTLTLTNLNLPGSTVLTLAITGAADLSGNMLAAYTSQFTTAPAFDTTHGSVVNQRPATGATGVSVGASPVVMFVNKPLDPTTISNNTVQVTQNGQLVSGTLALVGNGQAIEFTPSAPWTYGALVQVFLSSALDTVGNTVNSYKGTFTVVSDPTVTAPVLVNYSPLYNAAAVPLNVVPDAVYSGALDPTTAANVYLSSASTGQTIASTATLDSTGTIIHITPTATLAASSSYYVNLYNLKGVNGLAVSNQYYYFTTGTAKQTVAPTVVAVSPADKLGNVPVNANIAVLFSGPIDPLTVSGATISVSGGGMTSMPLSMSFSNSNQKVVITPEAPLPASTTMTLTISGVTDVAGNAVTAQTTQFTTGASPALSTPGVVVENPVAGSTGVPVNVAVSLQANAAIDPTTVSTSTFQVYDQTLGQTVAGTYSQSADGMTVYFLPAIQFATGRGYSVNFINGGMTDLAGNAVYYCTGCLSNFSFTTGNILTSVPVVTGVSPANGQTSVPLNAQLLVSFNEPVYGGSLGGVTLTSGGASVAVSNALSSGNQLLTVTPVAGLQPNKTYTLTISGVADVSGKPMTTPVTATFTTSGAVDLSTLRIVTVDPANNATGVPVNALVSVGFSKGVNITSLTGGNVLVYPYSVGSSYPVKGTLTESSDGTMVTFTPKTNLVPETQYGIYVTGVVDLEGNSLSGASTTYFTTGASSQSSGPVVVGVSPGNGATGVPVNGLVEVSLSESVSVVSVGQSAITVSAGGQAVAGTVTVPNPTTLLFTPSSSLAVSTAYTVTVGGFTDLAGNAATSFTSGFTTSSSSTAVKTGPTIVSVSPANSTTNVAVTAPIVVTFSAAVNPLTVTNASVRVFTGGNTLAGSYAVNGAVVTFTPLTALPGSASIQVYVDYYGNVQDLAGNNASSSATSFTTAATVDTTAPTVLTVVPANGQTGVGLNGQITVVFSESMNPSTLTTSTIALLAGGVKQSFSPSISADNRTLTLTNLNLPGSTVLTLAITGAADLSGNMLAAYTSQFTTAPAFDTTHGSVVNQRPATGATGVSVGASPVVMFVNKPLDPTTISNNTVQVTQNGQLVSGTLALVGNGQAIEFTPSAPWTYGALVQVFLSSALDTVGNTVNSYKGTFTVVSDPTVTAPVLVNYSPLYNAAAVPLNVVPDAVYSGALDPTTAANVYLSSASTGQTIASTATLDSTGTIIHITPTATLAASSSYYVNLYNLKGVNGLAVSNQYYYFTTGTAKQTVAPTVVAVSPADKLGNVPVNANIAVLFSGPIDPLTVSGATISVSGGGMTSMPLSMSFSNSNQKVVITPEAPLPASTTMTLTISGVTDVAGNAVTAQTTHFTTSAGPATSTPGVVVENPVAGATGVPVNVAISLQANAPIDPTTVSTTTFQVYDQTLSQTVAGTYSMSADGMTVYFLPAIQFATGRGYSVNFINGGMTDLAGNAVYYCTGCLSNFSFTTGNILTSVPVVTGVSPANGQTSVPLNAQLLVSFNEPVYGGSLGGVTLTSGGASVAVSNALSSGNQLLTVTPVAGLQPNKTYTLTISGVADVSGKPMTTPVTATFTTSGAVDLSTLRIVTVDPANNATGVPVNALVSVGFSKGVNITSLTGGNVLVYPYSVGSSYPVKGTLTESSDGTMVTFTPKTNLVPETQYGIYVTGVVDLEGNSLSGASTTYFTTGASSQSSGPVVVGVSPGNGATGVPVNGLVEVSLSESVSVVSVGQSAITVSAGGQAVAGTVTVPNPTTLLFTPSSSLAVSTAYTVTVGGFTDLAGNAATSFTSGFTTSSSSTAVKTGPTIVSVSPANSTTNVAVTAPIVVTFSAAVNPLTVTNASVRVFTGGNTLAGSYAVNGAVVTFTPLTALPGSASIQVYVDYYGNVQDLAGNNASSSATSFTTAATVDTTAPTVLTVVPANGQTGVGLNGQITVVFSESMNPSTLTTSTIALLAGGVKQSFSPSISADNRTLTLTNLNLPGSTVLTLAITGAADLSGNMLAAYTSQFTTAPAFDTTHGSVVNQRPATGATGVSVGASPVVMFVNKPLDPTTISNNTVQVTQNGQLVSGTLALVGNGQAIEFTPSAPWTYGALVQVFLSSALDTVGNTVNSYKGTFTVVSDPTVTAPVLVNYSPLYNAAAVPLNVVPDAVYSGALDPTTAANVYLSSASTGQTIASTATLDSTGTIIHITPTATLAASSSYYVNLYNLKGVNGLAVSNQYYYFTTGTAKQTVAPTVVAVSPADKLGNVPVNANIAVLFSGPIDPLTVSGATISVSGGGMTSMPLSMSFSNSNQKVVITPEAPLPASTTMTLTISGVTDVAGNAVTAQTTHFTTSAGPATSTPGVVVENPVAGATGVPVNVAISLQANAPIDPTTVSTTTFQVYDQTLSQTVAGTYSMSADGMTVYFLPAIQFATGRGYSVNFINGGMTDLAGNAVYYCTGCLSNFSFTTGNILTSVPVVTGVSPANGQTSVPLNAQLLVSFNEPVYGGSLGGVTLTSGGASVAVSNALSSGNQLLTVTPVAGLQPNKTYTLTISGVADVSGKPMTTPVTATFTTSGAVDLSTLRIVTVDPANNATGVPVNALVSVGFSKGVNITSLTGGNVLVYPYSVGSSYPVKGTLTESSDGTMVTFTPKTNLVPETQYGIYVTGVVDLEGNSLSGASTTYFTTGASSQSSGPVVVGVSPGNGATGVPVNAVVEVGLSEPVSVVSVGQSAITLSAGGQAVAGTVTVPNSTTLLFTPASSLAVSTAYTVTVGGFTDLAGNAATGFTSGFTTSSSSTRVTTGPTIVSVSPANSTTNVAVTTPVVVTFSGAVNPLSVNSNTVRVFENNNTLAGTYAVNGAVVTFTPLTAMPGSTTINVYVNYYANVVDLAGNNVSGYSATSFTTAATLDTTAPTVLTVTPANGQTGVGLNGQITVVFSKSMNPSTLTTSTIALLAGGVKQSFSTSISADNRTLTLTNLNLPGSTVLTLAITGATDLSGNALAAYTSQFTTAAAFDTTHASVVNQRPATGATGVSVGASPVVMFVNKSLDPTTISNNTVQVTQNGQLVSGTLALVDNGQTITFTPSAPWTYGALVQVFLSSALDTVGNTVNSYKGTFTVISDPTLTAPALLNYSPVSGVTGVPLNVIPDAVYSGALDPTTVIPANVYLYSSTTGKTIATTLTLDSTGTIIHITPTATLAASSTYYVYLYNLKGTNGLAVSNQSHYFATGTAKQTVAPTVVAVSPADKLGNVPVNANIAVLFSGPIDPLSVSGSTVSVSGGGVTSMPLSMSFSNSNSKVLITPEAPLPASTTMTLTISGVTDVAGNAVTAQTTHFTTSAAPATSTPGVLVENPVAGATGVPVNVAISLQANAPIDPTTVSTTTFQVYDQTLSQTVAGTYSMSADGMTVYFLPTIQLATGRGYTIYFNGYGMTDLVGNTLTTSCTGCLNNYSFTTGYATSAAAPQVTGVSPSNGLTNVPINAQVRIAFNEPVNGESLSGITLSANGIAVALTSSLSSGNQTLSVIPVAGLLANTIYSLTIVGLADFSGNVMTAPVTFTFTTGAAPDFNILALTSVTPVNGGTGVLTTASIQVQFNKLINVLSLNSQSVKISTNGTTFISAVLTFNTAGNAMTITPSSPLSPSTTYSLQLTTAILDLEGGTLTAYQSSFTTGTQ